MMGSKQEHILAICEEQITILLLWQHIFILAQADGSDCVPMFAIQGGLPAQHEHCRQGIARVNAKPVKHTERRWNREACLSNDTTTERDVVHKITSILQ
jgi:hypothetical protein